jgi:hypothetical protein
MPNVIKEFDTYTVQYTSSKEDLPSASISCFNGTEWVGLLTFWERRSSVREPSLINGRITLSYTLDRFRDVLDLLRNEEPLQLFLNPTAKWGSIITKDREPVGEGE